MGSSSFWPLVWQIARTETILRLRRFSTVIMVLLMLAAGFWAVPDPSSGYTVISANGQRVLYDSLAIALGGSSLTVLMISLAGFYLIGNSISRDVRYRMGAVLAATPASNTALIVGKWLGNSAYLGCVVLAMIPGGILVQLLRGEAPIQVLDFLLVYSVVFLPQVLFVSAIALWFESERWLRGRFGEVLYLFIWGGLVSIAVEMGNSSVVNGWMAMLDISALGFIVTQLSAQFDKSGLSIGFGDFDASLAPVVLNGMEWSQVSLRALSVLPALVMLGLAIWRFHRYNPDRVKAGAVAAGFAWWSGINRRLQFLSGMLRPVWRVLPLLPAPVARVLADVLLTLSATPVWLAAFLAGNIVALLLPSENVAFSLLFSLSAGALATAEIGIRDQHSGMWQVLAATPRIPESFLRWKFATALVTIALFVAVPLARLISADPLQALTLFIGMLFCVAASLAGAVLSQGAKLFVGAYLFLLYMTVNASTEPGFDFAGINNIATDTTRSAYAIAAVALVLLTTMARRWQQR